MTAPDEGTLCRFLLGQLPTAEAGTVEAYIETEPGASEVLDRLAASDPFITSLRGRTGEPDVSAEAEALARRLEGLPAEQTRTAGDDSSDDFSGIRTEQDVTAFLAPPQGPGELGRLGDFRVLRVLGRGGMGVVFEAEDTRLGRRVAVKAMLPKIAADPLAKQRFLREAKAAAAVEHDHVVPIHHIEEANGVPFLVMPFLKGESLDARLKRVGTLPIADVVRIGREVAEGLAAAHAQGLVHRDIKPGNLWLEAPRDRVKILDFGLARPMEKGTAADITQSGAIVGTPAYMSPEQGRGQAVDFRTDLFSLGGVLYRACTGKTPFSGADTASILMALAADTPVDPRQLNPRVPGPLAALILKLLEKDPAKRPASAREVAWHLSPAVEALPEEAPRPEFAFDTDETEVVPLARPVAKRRRTGLWIGVAIALLVIGVGLLFAPTIIRVATNKGELVVEVDDPNTEVVVKGEAVEIRVDEGGKRRVYEVRATENGQYEVRDPGSGVVLVTDSFQVKRGGRAVARVPADKLTAARKPKPIPAAGGARPAGPPPPATGLAWTGDQPPPKDLFPGELIFHAAFTDPKAPAIAPAQAEGVRATVEGGASVLERVAPQANDVLSAELGPPVTDMAFATRLKADNAAAFVTFRNRNTETRCRWLAVEISPDGLWSLFRNQSDLKDGKWVNSGERLAVAPAADPALANGKWVSVAGRAVGKEYELCINGERVAHGTDDDGFAGPNRFRAAIQVGARAAAAARARLAIQYAAGWDLAGPAGWTGEMPPPKDLFVGETTVYETFDDPKVTNWFQGTKDGVTFAVETGSYVIAAPTGAARAVGRFGPPVADSAFAARVRSPHVWQADFRHRGTATRASWLNLCVYPDGRWRVGHSASELVDGTWRITGDTVLKESTRPDPALEANKWIAVAARTVGDEYEVWLNGVSAARGTVADPAGPAWAPVSEGVALESKPAAGLPFRLEIDHVAIWKLAAPKK